MQYDAKIKKKCNAPIATMQCYRTIQQHDKQCKILTKLPVSRVFLTLEAHGRIYLTKWGLKKKTTQTIVDGAEQEREFLQFNFCPQHCCHWRPSIHHHCHWRYVLTLSSPSPAPTFSSSPHPYPWTILQLTFERVNFIKVLTLVHGIKDFGDFYVNLTIYAENILRCQNMFLRVGRC